jgi:hypothetical protein
VEAAGIEPAFPSRRQGGPDTTIVVMSDHPVLGRVMVACVISVIGVTLNRRRSDSRIAFTEVDRRQLKGFAEPVRTFEFRGAISDQEN